MDIQIINPLTYPGWDDMLLSSPGYSFFHTSAWARVLAESYGYTPLYFTVLEKGKMRALMPIMEVNSFLTSKRGISLPFTDFCDPIILNGVPFPELMSCIIECGKKRKWKYFELRGGQDFLHIDPPSSTYLGHTVDLIKGEEQIFSRLRDSTKRNIKKAVKEGVKVEIFRSLDSVQEFYRLNCLTRKDHGLPPQPYPFFKKVYEHILLQKSGFVVLASYDNKNIAGNVYFHFGSKAIYKYGASDKEYQNLRANNLTMWKAIEWYCGNGHKTLDFGRTEPQNEGLRQFKAGWGAKEHKISYYKYDLTEDGFITSSKAVTRLHNKILRKIPIPLSRVIGTLLYKHVA